MVGSDRINYDVLDAYAAAIKAGRLNTQLFTWEDHDPKEALIRHAKATGLRAQIEKDGLRISTCRV